MRLYRKSGSKDEPMNFFVAVIRAIGAMNKLIGNVFSWLALAMVLICFTVVIQRYALGFTVLWMQDLYVWLNGAMFTAVAGFALLRDDHVRVDIFYRPASIRTKAIIDLIGVIFFLLPFCWIVTRYSWNYIGRSWRLYEASGNVGGMPGLFILKSFILVFVVVVALQGIAWVLRSILVLRGQEHLLPSQYRYPVHQE